MNAVRCAEIVECEHEVTEVIYTRRVEGWKNESGAPTNKPSMRRIITKSIVRCQECRRILISE